MTSEPPSIEVEVAVQSRDGMLRGRVDRAEHRSEGTWLLDYKAALREDLPERYERQVRLYAHMWRDTRGEWPVEAHVLYPLTGIDHVVSVEPGLCQQVATESMEIIAQTLEVTHAADLAAPGDVCKVCDFRPWCQSFWDWQPSELSPTTALERTILGFEGRIRHIKLTDYRWRLGIVWRGAEVQLQAAQERFPHLAIAKVGMMARVLDTALRGLRHQPRAITNEYSELYLVL